MILFDLELPKSEFEEEKQSADKTNEFKIEKIEPLMPTANNTITDFGFDPVFLLLCAAPLSHVVKRIIDYLLKKNDGVVLDLRGKRPKVSRISKVPMGFLVIMHPDGRVTHHQSTNDDEEESRMESLLMEIIQQASN
jgi:hypothetical protein